MKAFIDEIILIGGSAGSYSLILDILEAVPNPISSAICVILHRNSSFSSSLEERLSLQYNRRILGVYDKMPIFQNHIYFAPSGYHLLLESDFTFALELSEPENFSIPSIDVFFESCAQIYRERCTAFLLSGANSDGSRGLQMIEEFGGKVFVQDPDEASVDVMPRFAIEALNRPIKLSNHEIVKHFSLLS